MHEKYIVEQTLKEVDIIVQYFVPNHISVRIIDAVFFDNDPPRCVF
jgi:hypothetical protein